MDRHQFFPPRVSGFIAIIALLWLADTASEVFLLVMLDQGWISTALLHPVHLVPHVLGLTAAMVTVILAFRVHRRMKESAQASDAKFHASASAVGEAVILMESDGRIGYWNSTAERLFGYSAAEAIGQDVHSLIVPPEQLQAAQAAVERFRRSGTGEFIGHTTECVACHRDGRRFPIELTLSRVQIGGTWQAVGVVRDLTAIKEARGELELAYERLAVSHRQWVETFDGVQDPLFLHDGEGRILRANRAYAEKAGVSPEEARGRFYWELFPKRSGPLPGCLKTIRNAEKRGVDEVTLEDGSIFHSRAITVLADDNTYLHSMHIMEDVTESRRVEQALRERDAKLQAIFAGARNVGLVLTRVAHGTPSILEFSPGAEAISGYRREEVLGKSVASFFLPEDVADFGNVLARMQRERSGITREKTLLRKGNEPFPALLTLHPVWGADGEMDSVVAVALDISELKKAEEQLRLKNEIWEAMFSNMNVLVACLDRDFNFLRVNPAYATAAGTMTPEEFVGKNHFDLFPNEENEAIFRRTVETGELFSTTAKPFEYPDQPERGVTYWDWTLVPTKDSEGRVGALLLTLIDVTEREQRRRDAEAAWQCANTELEWRVAERTAALEAANREMEAFSYSVSHDLRGPLRAINGFAEILREDYGDRLDETGLNYLGRLRDATTRMGDLIDGLLSLSRIMRSKLDSVPVNLTALANEIAHQLETASPERKVAWHIEPNLVVKGDPTLLGALLQNLLDNAWKFTARQESARISVGREWHGGRVTYFVRDNGIGFDKRHARKLFEPFERLHTSAEYEGTGIGLATVQRIIQRHDGEVWAEGEPGQGATIFFTLGTKPIAWEAVNGEAVDGVSA